MKIIISAQHLYGNDPEGFDAVGWLAALAAEYRAVAASYFPHAEIVVTIDCQRTGGGYCRAVDIDYDDDADASAADKRSFESVIDQTQNALYDQRAEEFFA